MIRVLIRASVVVCALVALVTSTSAQTTTTSSETKSFEVIAVDGNQLVVKLPEGTREITVPEGFMFTVDGRQLSVRELKPGMKGTATITTKTTVTPVSVTEVKNGTVMQANGNSIMVRTDEGIKVFTESDVAKRGVKIVRNGEPASITDFHTGDVLSATIVTSKPPRVATQREVQATLARSNPPPAAAPPSAPPTPAAPTATTGSTPPAADAPTAAAKTLPKTASMLPNFAATGLASLLVAIGLTLQRRRR